MCECVCGREREYVSTYSLLIHVLYHIIFVIVFVAVDCGSLTSPVNGNISLSGTTFESVADYTCQAGYLLVGSESRLCQANRTWSGDSPICEGQLIGV